MENCLIVQKNRIHLLTILLAGFITYCISVKAGFLILDDYSILNKINTEVPSINKLFLGSGNITYYRPVTILTYIFDFTLFGARSSVFHFVNVTIHLFNSVLVYLLVLELMKEYEKKNEIAFLSALLFVLHPINTEAVVWISARTDLLACFFSLLTLNLLIARQHSPTYLTSCLLFFSCLFALMSKESAIAMLPLTFLYLAINRTKMRTRNALLLIIPIALATILYFCLRSGMHSLTDQGIINSVSVKNSLGEIILADLAAYGFYLRKMLFPFPLNMAITNISFPVNLIVCVVLFLFMALSFWRKKELRIPLIIVLTGLAPPILALNGGLPWTPYAERYTYLPLTGGVIIMGIVLMHYGRKLPYAILVIGVLILALPTVLRITVWCDPISFWRDAVAQSPKYAPVRLLLAGELIKNGKKKEAKEELVKANNVGLSRKVDKKDYARLMHDIEKTNPNSL